MHRVIKINEIPFPVQHVSDMKTILDPSIAQTHYW